MPRAARQAGAADLISSAKRLRRTLAQAVPGGWTLVAAEASFLSYLRRMLTTRTDL